MTRVDARPLLAVAGGSAADIAARLGVTQRTVERWKAEGLSERQADNVAVALGLHPFEIWPELLEAELARQEELERERRRQRQERQREYQAAYRERNRESARRYARAYYRRNRAAFIAQVNEARRQRRATQRATA
jgi:hypothetical protein